MIGCVSLPAFLISSKRLLERGHSPLALASSVFGVCALLFTAALGAMRWFARFSPEAHASTMCADARDTLCGSITLPPLAWRAVFFSATFGAALP